MSRLEFSVNWDYRCPFARNAHEHVMAGLEAGADWDVTYVAFSLNQAHVEEGQPATSWTTRSTVRVATSASPWGRCMRRMNTA